MKKLPKIMPDGFLEDRMNLILSLTVLFAFFLVIPFITQEDQESAKLVISNGLVLSSLYAILAMGFSLIYGVAKQFKLSIGGYFVVGAYSMYFLLETARINPTWSKLDDIDGLLLLALALLPIGLIVALLVFFWTVFERREFPLLLAAVLIAGGSVILSGGWSDFVEGLYAGLAVLALALAAWYLELPKREVAFGALILGILVPLMIVSGLPPDISVVYVSLAVVGTLFTAFLAAASDRYLLDRFRGNLVNTMIVTFCVALLIQSVVQLVYFPEDGKKLTKFGPFDRTLRSIAPWDTVDIFGAHVEKIRIVSFVLTVLICILLYLFIWYSKMGMAMRAVSQDEEAAALTGIDIRKTTAIVSGIGMGLVAFAAILTSSFSAKPTWSPYMGWWILIMAIVVVILGGIGSLPGSAIAAFIVGYVQVLIASIPAYANLSVVFPLIIVFIVLIFKPEGLLGEKKELEE